MNDWKPGSWAEGALALLLALPVTAQPTGSELKPGAASADGEAGKPLDELSAEERIRRATLPPPGKACAPDPAEAERAKQDAKHAKNLRFVALSNQTVEQANEIASRAWASQQARLAAQSKADLEDWLNAQATRTAASSVANPCRLQKPQGHGASAPNTESDAKQCSGHVSQKRAGHDRLLTLHHTILGQQCGHREDQEVPDDSDQLQ